jgi:aspartyl-tRNA(Asn)/glutamyl-tRNA(Gln) amidotransferase subunit C
MKFDISRVATLASLPLTDDEKKKLVPQLEETLKYVEVLEEVDTKNVEPTSQVTGLENVTRADKAQASLSQEEALSNTKETHNGYVMVPVILESEQ